MFDIWRITILCLGYRLSKHKMTICSKNIWGGHGPLGYAYGLKNMIFAKEIRQTELFRTGQGWANLISGATPIN